MAELIDSMTLGPTQWAELYEGGKIIIRDDLDDPFLQAILTLEAGPATLLFDFLRLHQDRLIRHRDAKQAGGETYVCVHCGQRHALNQLCPQAQEHQETRDYMEHHYLGGE